MTSRNQKIDDLMIVLDTMHRLGQMRHDDYSFFHDAINGLRDPEPVAKDANAEPEFNAGFDRLENLIAETLAERDCE